MIRIYDMATGELLHAETEGSRWTRHSGAGGWEIDSRPDAGRQGFPARAGIPEPRLALVGETPTDP